MNNRPSTITETQVKDILLKYLNRKRAFSRLSLNDVQIQSINTHDTIIVS
jgi:hypothetical protein